MATVPSFLGKQAFEFRLKFLQEELDEFARDHAAGDMHGAADALVDLAYVLHGTALMMGLPWAALWDEVQRAKTAATSVSHQIMTPKHFKLDSSNLKPKDLVGIPWMVAFALRADGWWLRSDIVWQKPNVLPESVTDRPTKSHEYVFLLAKSAQYFYDMDAVREPCTMKPQRRLTPIEGRPSFGGHQAHTEAGYRTRDEVGVDGHPGGRNLRDVWSINTRPYKGAHFATMPPALVVPCIKAGTSERGCCPSCGAPWERQGDREKIPDRPGRVQARKGDSLADAHGQDGRAGNRHSIQSTTTGWEPTCTCSPQEPVPCTVLDPFGGSGTTAEVARSLGRDCILIELNPDYIDLAKIRLYGEREPERADLEATSDHEGPSLLEMLGM